MIQTLPKNSFKSKYFDGGIIECYKYIVKVQGYKGLWRGFIPCVLGGVFANGIIFSFYENSKHLFLDSAILQ